FVILAIGAVALVTWLADRKPESKPDPSVSTPKATEDAKTINEEPRELAPRPPEREEAANPPSTGEPPAPEAPAAPAEPEAPSQPAAPEAPTAPERSAEPEKPAEPAAPEKPAEPEKPA